MNIRTTIAVTLLGLVAGVGCSSSPSPATMSAGSVATTKWSAEAKAGVRQLMAVAAQGPELDCSVDVVTSIYSPEDWTYAVAHGSDADLPARMKDLEDKDIRELERRCGIKDTRVEDQAKADAMTAWNAAVDEWNTLTDQRDAAHAPAVIVDGRAFGSYGDWAKAFGKPLSPPA